MRGRTFKNSVIILDEAQNTTVLKMLMFLTRLGNDSKMIVNGDDSQIDLDHDQKSGLIDAKNILQDVNGIGFVYFSDKDVVRHRLVQEIIKAYDEKGTNRDR